MDLDSLIGRTLDGKYLIERQLGAGGMGAVFRATHTGTDRPVALKLIAPSLMQNAEVLERFKREARAAGRLQHPNVVNVTDFGIAQFDGSGVAYLAMEYLDGFTLGELLRKQQKLALQVAIDILEQVAIAVDQAHRLGIVHRDLKPDNIWLAPDGRGGYQVKVLDFGVAAFRESALVETKAAADSETARIHLTSMTTAVGVTPHLTQAGTVIGTPAYMSPEQCSGAPVTAKSDIYSLGVIAYQMISGELPFNGNTFELIAKHVAAPPPDPANVPKPVAAVMLSALAKNADARPVSASAFAGALRARSENASMVVRRAVALFSLHFGEIMRLSLATLGPGFLGLLIGIAILFFPVPHWIGIALIAISVGVTAAGGLVLAGSVFMWMRHQRSSPFQPVGTAGLILRLAKHIPGGATITRKTMAVRVWRLMWFDFLASLRALRADRALRFYALIESNCDVDRTVNDAVRLTKALPKSMRFIDVASVATVFPILLIWPGVAFWPLLGIALPSDNALSAMMAGVCVAVIAVLLFVVPLTALSYAILYFRARQALGEDVSLSVEPRL